jgi:hypothetical protein
MPANYGSQIINTQKLISQLHSINDRTISWFIMLNLTPYFTILFIDWIRPYKITESVTRKRNLLKTIDCIDLFYLYQYKKYIHHFVTDTTMHTKILSIHYTRNRHSIKQIQYTFIYTLGIFVATLLPKIILLSHYLRFVVAPQKNYTFTIFDFKCHQNYHNLDRIYSSVDIVSQKDKFTFKGTIVSKRVTVREDV